METPVRVRGYLEEMRGVLKRHYSPIDFALTYEGRVDETGYFLAVYTNESSIFRVIETPGLEDIMLRAEDEGIFIYVEPLQLKDRTVISGVLQPQGM